MWPSRKLSPPHDILDVIPRCSNDILKNRQYAINDWQFCHLRDASISRSRLVRTRSLKTRELIPEDVKFFNSTVNASTAIVRGYICLRLLAHVK
ncbi:hypothetical protein D6D29_05639 [Aureobasidium pullulans]|nr:hypothetical protein D6D29_05639 [Aureobasidium pullulans]